MSPILLDHRILKVLWLGVATLVFMTFMGGYILGFEKSNSTRKTNLDPVELALPAASTSALAEVGAKEPEFEQPGADIDVDVADASDQIEPMYHLVELRLDENTVEPLAKEPAKTAATDTGFVGPMQAVSTEIATLTEPLPNNAAVQSVVQPQIEAQSEPSLDIPAIVDDATEATAKYSIQEGMYSSSANAVAREEQLRKANLSAYSLESLNSNDESRYYVRFGYFASKESAQQALDVFQQQFSANGFIVRFKR